MNTRTVSEDEFCVFEISGWNNLVVVGKNDYSKTLVDILKEDGSWQKIVRNACEKNDIREAAGIDKSVKLRCLLNEIANEVNDKIKCYLI